MIYRQSLNSTAEMAQWYNAKYEEMGGCWYTPEEELDRHLNDFGLTGGDATIVDIGCGDGSLVRRAVAIGYAAFGLEISQQAIGDHTNLTIRDICAGPLDFQADYIISLGSLEHVIDLDAALNNIHSSLKPEGRWYFFVPNELWPHFDQPNERTATDEEWIDLFADHGLITESVKRWGDCSALQGRRRN